MAEKQGRRTLKNEQCRLENNFFEQKKFRVILDKDKDIGQKDITPQAEVKRRIGLLDMSI